MSRVYLFIAVIIALTGLAASFFAPTENMGVREAFYAHLLLIAPPLFIATVISALGIIIHRLDQLLGKNGSRADAISIPTAAENREEDFGSLFAETLRIQPEPETLPFESQAFSVEEPVAEEPIQSAEEERRAPTVDEYLLKAHTSEEPPSSSRLAREGTFAGRHYRMYEDGSLEIDTDQSTIRFDSLEEFRAFVSSAGKE